MITIYIIAVVVILWAVYMSGYYRAKRKYTKTIDELYYHIGTHQIPEESELNNGHSPVPDSWNDRMSDEEFYNEIYRNN